MNRRFPSLFFSIFSVCLASVGFSGGPVSANSPPRQSQNPIYLYTLTDNGTSAAYDEAMAVASLQAIINRKQPVLYVLSATNSRPEFWLKILSEEGRWLGGRERRIAMDLHALARLAGKRLRGAVIWDPRVPATVNVATTIAGVEDYVIFSPQLAERLAPQWKPSRVVDLRDQFTGKETGSAKNDAYRWALREYLARGRCSAHRLCLFEDAFSTRAHGDIGYVVTRDWAMKSRAFVYDLSPWGDEVPGDDPSQRPGADLETYKLILDETLRHSAGKEMTEVAGFFAFSKYASAADHKSRHEPVPTEWESVWLMSPYNCYQNTIASACFNQSFHSQAPRAPLHQRAPVPARKLENKNYLCVLMADYDSATPLYDFLPTHWADPKRGSLPLAWGINPNLIETYPDLVNYFYTTASSNDTFTADASAAGYMNPNRMQEKYLPLYIKHNRRFFREADMDIAPMVLDWDQPKAAVKDAFTKFAPSGFATIVLDYHNKGGRAPAPQVWKGMPVTELINATCNFENPEQTADIISHTIQPGNKAPGFYFFRIVWVGPGKVGATMNELRRKYPALDFELVDPHTFFFLFKQFYGQPQHP